MLIDLCGPCDAVRHRELRAAKDRPSQPPPQDWKQGLAAALEKAKHMAKQHSAARQDFFRSPAAPPPASPDSVLDSLQGLHFPGHATAAGKKASTAAPTAGTAATEDSAEAASGSCGFPSEHDGRGPPDDAMQHTPTPSPAFPSEANQQAAEEWALKAQARYESGDDAAALRFCEKSLRLGDNASARHLEEHLKKFGHGTSYATEAARVLAATAHHEVLQLSRADAASVESVKKAYKRLCLLLHPDRNRARQAEAAFKRLQSAYEALKAGGVGGGGGSDGGDSRSYSRPSSAPRSAHGSTKMPRCQACSHVGEDVVDGLCDECYEEEELAKVARESARRHYGYASGAYANGGSRCSGCDCPYRPPPSYVGNRPLCPDCRDDFDFGGSYGRYGGGFDYDSD